MTQGGLFLHSGKTLKIPISSGCLDTITECLMLVEASTSHLVQLPYSITDT